MDETVARSMLTVALHEYRGRPYRDLAGMVGQVDVREVRAPDGTALQIELQVMWDGTPGGAVLVLGAIDDGRLRAFRPLTLDFIRNPDGSFAGE